MVEELKLAIKIDDASIEQSLLKQFANAQKMADKVVLDFKNVNFDDKQIEAKFKEMQKKAGQNPIDLTIGGNTLNMLGQIDKRLTEIFSIGKGKSFIDSSSIAADIGKIENKINELNKKYEESQKKLSSIGSGNISGKDVNLVDNKEFQKLSQEVSELKNQFGDLKTHMQLLDDYTVPTDRFFELQSQVEATTVKVSDLIEEFTKLSNAQKALSSTAQESNISLGNSSTVSDNTEIKANSEVIASIEKKKQELASYELQLEETRYEIEKLSKTENEAYGFKKAYSNMNDKYINSRKESLYNSIFGTDKSKGQGSMKYQTMNLGGNVEKGYAAWREELERLGYTLSELRKTNIGVEADIIPIDGKAITNAEEFRKALFGITSIPSDNIKVLNKQISELESKISSLKSEISSLESVSNNPKKDAFPDKDVSTSVEAATNSIKEENNVLEQNTQKVKENADAKKKLADTDKESSNVNLSKYDNRLESYAKKTSGYDATITRFEDGGWTSDTYKKRVNAVKEAVAEYERILISLKNNPDLVTEENLNKLDKQEKLIKENITAVQNMSAAEKGYSLISAQKELDKINNILREHSGMSREAKNQIKAYYAEIKSGNPSASLDVIHGKIMQIVNAESDAGRAGKSMWSVIKEKAWYGVAGAIGTYFGFNDILRYGGEVVNIVKDLNTQITELAKVSEQSSKQIYSDFDSYADIAKEVRGTISDTIAATADWSKNGYSIPDAKELAEISQLYKNVGDGINIDEANESLISTLKGFKLEADEAEHIVDVFNEVSNNEAISSAGIGDALQRSAASFNAANTSLEKSVALVTATNSVLQDPEKVGNMWKTVSARIRGAKTELTDMGEDTDGLVESTSKLQALVKSITGVDILESDGKTFKDIYTIVGGISEKWATLSDIDRASLLESLAGKNQSNALAAALSQPEILKKAYEEATNAEGSARRENEEYSKSIQASIDLAQAKLEQLANDTLNSNFLKGAIDAGGKLIEVLNGIVKSGNAIPTLLAAIGAGFSFKNVGEWNYISKFHFNNIVCFIV